MEYDKINEAQYWNLNKICGIYCIYNEEYFYVGQSNNIRGRWNNHRSKLKRGKHDNYIMQQIYDKKTTEDPFQYKIICECEEKDLDKLEIIIKNKLCEKYPNKICMNIAQCGGRNNWTDEMKRKASESHKGKKIPKEVRDKITKAQKGQKRPILWKKIVQLDLDGNLIKVWNSVKEAEEFTGCSIMYSRKACKGYQWQPYEEWKKAPKGKVIYNTITPINQYEKNGTFIRSYNSIREASNITGIRHSSISNAIHGRLKTAGGFIWKCQN